MKDGKPLVPNGENRYHAIFGGGPAYFVSASSLGPALIALGAKLTVVSASGNRERGRRELLHRTQGGHRSRGRSEAERDPYGDPDPGGCGHQERTYEIREREMLDWPLATASVALKMNGSTISSAKVVLGHVAPTPWVATAAGQFLTVRAIRKPRPSKPAPKR